MYGAARTAFLAEYGVGIGLLVTAYVLATALRDFRDNFAAELWNGLGYGNGAAIFTASELPVAVIALAALALIMAVRDNARALMVIHGVIIAGLALLSPGLAATLCGTSPCTSGPKETMTFSFDTPKTPGEYFWQCRVPCGGGFLDGFGGPMQTIGFMTGNMVVVN